MALVHLRAADRPATPWKNGRGVTREIAAHPPGAGLDAFDWRISMATVDQAGPFSAFEGVDRILTLIEGSLSLQLAGAAPVLLEESADPFAFEGEAACFGEPLGGAATDLNVMVRRGKAKARAKRIDGPVSITCASAMLCLVALDATVIDGAPLEPFDAVLLACGETASLTSAARLILVELD